MNVEIKQIVEEDGDVFLVIRCLKPQQKNTPTSHGRKELEESNMLFQKYAEEHRQEMKAYKRRMFFIHLGPAKLHQDGEE